MLGTLIQDRFPSDSEAVQALGEWKLPETSPALARGRTAPRTPRLSQWVYPPYSYGLAATGLETTLLRCTCRSLALVLSWHASPCAGSGQSLQAAPGGTFTDVGVSGFAGLSPCRADYRGSPPTQSTTGTLDQARWSCPATKAPTEAQGVSGVHDRHRSGYTVVSLYSTPRATAWGYG